MEPAHFAAYAPGAHLITAALFTLIALGTMAGAWLLGASTRPARGAEQRAVALPEWFSHIRLLSIPISGWSLGLLSRVVRPHANLDGVHLEALASLFLLIVGSLLLFVQQLNTRESLRGRIYQLELFSLWTGYIAGWTLLHGKPWADMIGVMGGWWIGTAVISAIGFAVIRLRAAR